MAISVDAVVVVVVAVVAIVVSDVAVGAVEVVGTAVVCVLIPAVDMIHRVVAALRGRIARSAIVITPAAAMLLWLTDDVQELGLESRGRHGRRR